MAPQNTSLLAEKVPASELSNLKKHAQGISAPEPSYNQSAAPGAPLDEEADFLSVTQDNLKAEKLDHNARLFFELDPQGGSNNLYSFYCEYSDYLDDRNLIDVSTFNLTNKTELEQEKSLFI